MKGRFRLTAPRIALALAIITPIFWSSGFFAIGYFNIATILRTEAEANALYASEIINANPEYWRFEQARLQEFLSSRRSNNSPDEIRRIVDLDYQTVAENRAAVEHPIIMRSCNLYDSGRVVAKLEIIRSLGPLMGKTFLVGLIGTLLSVAIYLPVKKYVLDTRRQAEAALKESEEKYRLLVSKMPALAFKGYADWAVDFFDDKITGLTGYAKAEFDARSLKWSDIILPEDLPGARDEFIQALKTNKSYTREYRIKSKDESITWIQERGQIICHQDGRIDYISGVFFDISNRKIIEEERLTLSKMESLGILAGGIAHDFNNILTVILGNINLAMMDRAGEDDRKILAEAEKACFQAQSLSRQLLTFAKGGAPVKGPVAVERLLKESAALVLRGSQVRGDFSFPDNLWALEADRGQLNQVFQNLLINAIQAMPLGGSVKIVADNLVLEPPSDLPLSPGSYVKITLQDQGSGLAPEYLDKIFDPYFTTKQKGSGLGLATAYSIIKNHHGHIAVESKSGEGTTFHIYLPAFDRNIVPPPEPESGLLFGKGKILIMDDDELVRSVLGKMLVHLGYEPKFASNGEEAITLFTEAYGSEHPFDAVVLDLTVPGGMGGKEAIAKLREIDPKIKAIVSSGYSDDPVMADFHKYGFSGIIPKPYRVAEASKVLHETVMDG